MKNKQSVVAYKFFSYSAPYCRESKIQHPTSRMVGTLEYVPADNSYFLPRTHGKKLSAYM